MNSTANLSAQCLRTSRSSRPCARCGASVAGTRAHIVLDVAGIYCGGCCPACNPESRIFAGRGIGSETDEERRKL
jgi:hypothetical protein